MEQKQILPEINMSLKMVYKKFLKGKEMDIKQYGKLIRDAKILDLKFNDIEADIIFAKNQNRLNKKLDFKAFNQVVCMIAEKKGIACKTYLIICNFF